MDIDGEWEVVNGYRLITTLVIHLMYGICIQSAYAPECRTYEGSTWSPAWEARLALARTRFLHSPMVYAMDRLSNISLSLPDMKDAHALVDELPHVREAIRLCR